MAPIREDPAKVRRYRREVEPDVAERSPTAAPRGRANPQPRRLALVPTEAGVTVARDSRSNGDREPHRIGSGELDAVGMHGAPRVGTVAVTTCAALLLQAVSCCPECSLAVDGASLCSAADLGPVPTEGLFVPPPSIVAERLRASLGVRNMTPTDLARRIGRQPRTVGNWCNGETLPSADDVADCCRELGVSGDYLLGLSTHENGLEPDLWIIDLDEVDRPTKRGLWSVKIPRRARLVGYDEMREIERQVEVRKKKERHGNA